MRTSGSNIITPDVFATNIYSNKNTTNVSINSTRALAELHTSTSNYNETKTQTQFSSKFIFVFFSFNYDTWSVSPHLQPSICSKVHFVIICEH